MEGIVVLSKQINTSLGEPTVSPANYSGCGEPLFFSTVKLYHCFNILSIVLVNYFTNENISENN